MYCPRNENWMQRKQVCEPLNNRNEDKNESSDDNSSEDGSGLIDPRMKPRAKASSTAKPAPKEGLSVRSLPNKDNIDKKDSNATTKKPQTTVSNFTTKPIHRGTKPIPTSMSTRQNDKPNRIK